MHNERDLGNRFLFLQPSFNENTRAKRDAFPIIIYCFSHKDARVWGLSSIIHYNFFVAPSFMCFWVRARWCRKTLICTEESSELVALSMIKEGACVVQAPNTCTSAYANWMLIVRSSEKWCSPPQPLPTTNVCIRTASSNPGPNLEL